jgi:hypothetical protein
MVPVDESDAKDGTSQSKAGILGPADVTIISYDDPALHLIIESLESDPSDPGVIRILLVGKFFHKGLSRIVPTCDYLPVCPGDNLYINLLSLPMRYSLIIYSTVNATDLRENDARILVIASYKLQTKVVVTTCPQINN